jgi:hypothetical protein
LIRELLGEISAENALRESTELASRVRYANSESFFESAEYVAGRARGYGLQNVRVERFETQRPMWDPLEATLEITAPVERRLSTLDQVSVLLAQGSRDADLTAELVSADQDVKGKIVLSPGDPGRVWPALEKRGALAVICAHSPEFFGRRPPSDAVSWGSVAQDGLAMMVSPLLGDELRDLMSRGPVTVRIHARARRSSPGAIGQVMGEIPGEDPALPAIVLLSHLDHQKPGANDNASGAGTLLETLRTLTRLTSSGKLPKPRRTLRFWWTTEIRSEQMWFRRYPEEAKRMLAAVVLDQAGGDRNAENNFVVIYGPEWLPAYTDDLIYDLAESVKDAYAPAEHEPSPLAVAPGGSRQSMRTVYWDYQPLSDHVAFESRAVGVPAIALAVPSLHVIHTNLDTADRLDPTWLKRSALMTLAPAVYLANAGSKEAREILELTFRRGAARVAGSADPAAQLALEQKRLDSVKALDGGLETAAYAARLRAVANALEH